MNKQTKNMQYFIDKGIPELGGTDVAKCAIIKRCLVCSLLISVIKV